MRNIYLIISLLSFSLAVIKLSLYRRTLKHLKSSNELTINCSRTFDIIGCMDMTVRASYADVEYLQPTITLPAGRSGNDGFCLPFSTLFALQLHGGRWHFSQNLMCVRACGCMYVCVYIRPSTVILTKIRQRLAIVRVSVPASAYCVAIFFLPDIHRPRQDASVRASRFLCPDPGHRIRYGHGWLAIDERRLQKNAVAGAPEVPSPRDSVEQERTTGEVNFCFPALFSDYAEWSGVGLCTPECSYSRKSGLSEVVGGPCLRASCSREARVAQNGKFYTVMPLYSKRRKLKCV